MLPRSRPDFVGPNCPHAGRGASRSCADAGNFQLFMFAYTFPNTFLFLRSLQASAFGHNLALKCSMFRNDKADAEKKIRELEQSLESAKAAEKEALEAKTVADAQVVALGSQLSATIEEGRQQVVAALEQGRTDGFSAGRLAGKTEGFIEGRETFLSIRRVQNSPLPMFVFKVVHLKGFAEGFDQSRLDSSLDGQLQPYPPETASDPSKEDEFASLIEEIGYVP
ncbi:hypothetical protein Salat_2514500 [Sesamum alatum]|uniref:Uncharacterized protein n=1 Tax=Sesamum alatum TaxID=300844 RepID=A0AAE1XRY5_9LAMI|nr:hypothetical protein Salat_2514500 [Sesamum alatum]